MALACAINIYYHLIAWAKSVICRSGHIKAWLKGNISALKYLAAKNLILLVRESLISITQLLIILN